MSPIVPQVVLDAPGIDACQWAMSAAGDKAEDNAICRGHSMSATQEGAGTMPNNAEGQAADIHWPSGVGGTIATRDVGEGAPENAAGGRAAGVARLSGGVSAGSSLAVEVDRRPVEDEVAHRGEEPARIEFVRNGSSVQGGGGQEAEVEIINSGPVAHELITTSTCSTWFLPRMFADGAPPYRAR